MTSHENPYASPLTSDSQAPETPEWALPLARRSTRLVAAIIDGLLSSILFMPLYFATAMAFYPAMWNPEELIEPGMTQQEINQALANAQPGTLFTLMWSVIGFGIFLLLHGYLLATNGQTIGKWLLGIKIVRTDGTKATFGRLIGLRYLPLTLVAYIRWIGVLITSLVNPLLIFRESRKCLHDDIADTIVVTV